MFWEHADFCACGRIFFWNGRNASQYCLHQPDDFERVGEQNTVAIMRDILSKSGIAFCNRVYSGSKDLYLLASADLGWLTTM